MEKRLLMPGDVFRFSAPDLTYGIGKVLHIDYPTDSFPIPEPLVHLMIFNTKSIIPPGEAHYLEARAFISHLPILQTAFLSSTPEVILSDSLTPLETEAVSLWRDSFFKGESGVFDLPIGEAISLILESLKRHSS